jgi:hypothetical protein
MNSKTEKAYRAFYKAANPSLRTIERPTTPGQIEARSIRIRKLRAKYEDALKEEKASESKV